MNNQQFLTPGDYFFGRFDGKLVTLLGSCVAVTLWHPRLRLVAMTHYVLPHGRRFTAQDTHYGEAVFAQLQKDMLAWGTPAHEFQKGLFGGGSQLQPGRGTHTHVATSNLNFALEQFSRLGWSIERQQLGGGYRRLSLNGRDGSISCRDLIDPGQLRIRE